ncbi:tyrosine-type recombinase/integrase [Pantoea dispersa]|uniref:tyrosine-type recombinase/integrase n=1 Tax=Pantoea dispersa TaxID=59814 RepID=UPI0031FF1F9B
MLFYAAASSLRDRLILALIFYGALRRSEIILLRIGDCDFGHWLIRLRLKTGHAAIHSGTRAKRCGNRR